MVAFFLLEKSIGQFVDATGMTLVGYDAARVNELTVVGPRALDYMKDKNHFGNVCYAFNSVFKESGFADKFASMHIINLTG